MPQWATAVLGLKQTVPRTFISAILLHQHLIAEAVERNPNMADEQAFPQDILTSMCPMSNFCGGKGGVVSGMGSHLKCPRARHPHFLLLLQRVWQSTLGSASYFVNTYHIIQKQAPSCYIKAEACKHRVAWKGWRQIPAKFRPSNLYS